jgi:hypothetical protein
MVAGEGDVAKLVVAQALSRLHTSNARIAVDFIKALWILFLPVSSSGSPRRWI